MGLQTMLSKTAWSGLRAQRRGTVPGKAEQSAKRLAKPVRFAALSAIRRLLGGVPFQNAV
jgi:hypothetical protein